LLKKARENKNIQYFTLGPLEQTNSISHAFSGRLAQSIALDKGGYEKEKNRHVFCEALGINPANLVLGRQVHGNKVAVVRKKRTHITADAFITDQPGLALAVLTADCLPIILIDKDHPAIGVVHAGRQGTFLRIVVHALKEMTRLFATDPQRCLVGIGPAIGPCCYGISGDLAMPFREAFDYWEKFLWESSDGFFVLDLINANRLQLVELGVKEGNIFNLDLCTCCNLESFYSYRRKKGEYRRQLNLVMIR
jgi:YfiH family protein